MNSKELAWSAAPNGPPHLDHRSTYKLPESGVASMGPTVSPTALSKFLTAVSGKQFQNPPSEMLTSRGVAMHDLLELFSGKPGRVRLLCLAFRPSVHCLPAFCALPFSTLSFYPSNHTSACQVYGVGMQLALLSSFICTFICTSILNSFV